MPEISRMSEFLFAKCELKMMILSKSCRTAQVCFGFTASQMSKQDAENLQNFMEKSESLIKTHIEESNDSGRTVEQSIESSSRF
jgi:NCAIR mutase (PurE)-related protein